MRSPESCHSSTVIRQPVLLVNVGNIEYDIGESR
jgi:hypothetical protein